MRQSVALDQQRGHIFTLLIQGITGFDEADAIRDIGTSPRRTTLTFRLGDESGCDAIKVVGRWFDVAALSIGGQKQPSIGPTVVTQDPDGKKQDAFLIASPYDNARHVLAITCHSVPRLSSDPEFLVFYGGFAAPAIMNDTSQEAGFLAFIYPAADAEQLKKTIGTIDR
jgi:hypothetical protein